MSSALAPSLVVALTSAPAARSTRTISGASPPGSGGDRRVQRRAPGVGVAPVDVGAGVQQQAHQLQPAAAGRRVERAAVGVGAALEQQPAVAARRRGPPRTAGRRR